MTYHNAIKYIKNAPNVTPDDSLAKERITKLCEAIGNPQKKIKYVRLAGNNGKSVCACMITSILNKAGICSGALTMPLLSEIRENVRINGEPISIEETAKFTEQVSKAVLSINSSSKDTAIFAPTAHEIILCIALLAFVAHDCKLALIESEHNSGDPSRFLPIPISAIICGTIPSDDQEEISKIYSYIQRGVNEAISIPQDHKAFKIIETACHKANCRLTISVPKKAIVTSLTLGGSHFTYKNAEYSLRICGRFQVTNAILAIESCEMLVRNGYKIEKSHIKSGLLSLSLPSKFEIISISPTIIIDSTYAPIAIETVSDSMSELKHLTGTKVRLCLPFNELCEEYTEALTKRGYDIESIVALSVFDGEDISQSEIHSIPLTVCKTPKLAAKKALENLNSDTILLVSGKANVSEKIRYEMLGILSF